MEAIKILLNDFPANAGIQFSFLSTDCADFTD